MYCITTCRLHKTAGFPNFTVWRSLTASVLASRDDEVKREREICVALVCVTKAAHHKILWTVDHVSE